MECPKCGYAMSDFDVACPRCKLMADHQPQPPPDAAELPPVTAATSEKETQAKAPAPVVVELPKRPDALTWGLIAVGLAIVVLLAVVIWTQLRKPVAWQGSGTVAETPAQQHQPAQAPPGGTLATEQQQNREAAVTDAESLLEGEERRVPPATTDSENLAERPQQTVPPATTGAESLAEGEEQWYDPRQVRSWREAYRFTGSGTFTTSPMTVRRPWRVKYYTGTASGSTLDLDIFSIFPNTGPLSLPIVTVQNQPNIWGEGYANKSGTFPLTIGTTYNNWVVSVEQGEF